MSHTNFRNEKLSSAVTALMDSTSPENHPTSPLIGRGGNIMANAVYLDDLKVIVITPTTTLPMRFGYKTEDCYDFIDFATGPFISSGTALKDIIRTSKDCIGKAMKSRFGTVEVDKIYNHGTVKCVIQGKEEEVCTFIMTLKPAKT